MHWPSLHVKLSPEGHAKWSRNEEEVGKPEMSNASRYHSARTLSRSPSPNVQLTTRTIALVESVETVDVPITAGFQGKTRHLRSELAISVSVARELLLGVAIAILLVGMVEAVDDSVASLLARHTQTVIALPLARVARLCKSSEKRRQSVNG